MKKTVSLSGKLRQFVLCIAAAAAVCSCYDDDDIRNSLGSLEERVHALEEAVAKIQDDIDALRLIVVQLEKQVTVASVIPTDNGYVINFSDGTSAEITDGTDGVSAPLVTVEKDGDTYYWAYRDAEGNVTFITDAEGNRIPVTARAPQVRINPDTLMWEISQDGGVTWESTGVKAVGGDGGSLFESVSEDENFVYIVLKGGAEIRLPKATELSFEFETSGKLRFEPGQTKAVGYSMSGVSYKSISKPDGWKVVFAGESVEITAPPAENAYAETAGTVSVVAVAANGRSVIAGLEVEAVPVEVGLKIVWTQGDKFFTDIHFGSADETGAEELRPANTFLVRPGKTYRFRTNVMGCGSEGVAALGAGGIFGDFDLSADASVHPRLKGEYEYIYFTTYDVGDAAAGGVGVVSVTLGGAAAWSWTVWARDEDPEDHRIGDRTFMGVNLCSHGPHTIKIKLGHYYFDYPYAYYYGLPYSWGSPVPQPGLTSLNKAITFAVDELASTMYWMYEYDEPGKPRDYTERYPGYSVGMSAAVSNPLLPADLSAEAYAAAWGGGSGKKTVFDPCPYGYRVSGPEIYESMEFGLFGRGGLPYTDTQSGERTYLLWGGVLSVESVADRPSYFEADETGYYWTNAVSEDAVRSQAFVFGDDAAAAAVTPLARRNGALVRCERYPAES